MKKLITVVAFAVAMVTFRVEAHPIKMTTSKLSFDKKTNEFTLLVNFFVDDFGAHLEKIYHQRGVNFNSPGQGEMSMVSTYFGKKFMLKINRKISSGNLASLKKIEDNVVQAKFIFSGDKAGTIKLIEISDALLFDAFPDQQVNILHLELPAKIETSVLQFIPSESYKVLNTNF